MLLCWNLIFVIIKSFKMQISLSLIPLRYLVCSSLIRLYLSTQILITTYPSNNNDISSTLSTSVVNCCISMSILYRIIKHFFPSAVALSLVTKKIKKAFFIENQTTEAHKCCALVNYENFYRLPTPLYSTFKQKKKDFSHCKNPSYQNFVYKF